MGYVNLYNYDNNYAPIQVGMSKCFNFDAFMGGSQTSYSTRYGSLNLTRATGTNYKKLTFASASGSTITESNVLSKLEDILSDLGLSIKVYGNLVPTFSTVQNNRLTKSNTGLVNPYYNFNIYAGTSDYKRYYFSFTSSGASQQLSAVSGTYSSRYYSSVATALTFNNNTFGMLLFEIQRQTNKTSGTCTLTVYQDTSTTNALTVEAYPGEQGFIPIRIDPDPYDPRGGGTLSKQKPNYSTDVLTQPGEPDESVASAIGTGFIHAYDITKGNLTNVAKCLFSSTLLTALANLFIDPIEAIISLQVFPYTPHIGTSEAITLLNHKCEVADLGIDANGFPLTQQFRTIDFGTLTVDETWESFLDYTSTSCSLYLPFIGEVEVPINEIMNGSINVQYTIDYFTGMCVANVLCTRTLDFKVKTASQYSQHSYQGNCAVQLPIQSRDFCNMVGSLISCCATGLTAGLETGALSAGQNALSGAWKPTLKSKGAIQANAGFCSVLYPYISIERPVTAYPPSYQTVVGYPSYMCDTLGDYQGFCICDDINLSGISNATDNEMNRIKQLCKEGVFV